MESNFKRLIPFVSPPPAAEANRAYDEIERLQRSVSSDGHFISGPGGNTHSIDESALEQIGLGITTKQANDIYPTFKYTQCQFPVSLIYCPQFNDTPDDSYDPTKRLNYISGQGTIWAMNLERNQWVPEGTQLTLYKINGHWFFRYRRPQWGQLKRNWLYGTDATNGPWQCEIHPCSDSNGGNVDSDVTISVILPASRYGTPNLVSGEEDASSVILYDYQQNLIPAPDNDNGLAVILSPYLDDRVGMIKLWGGGAGNIPAGWVIRDGTANSVANGGSGVNSLTRFPRFNATAGTQAGADTHTHNDHDVSADVAAHPADVTGNNATANVGNSVTGVTVVGVAFNTDPALPPNAFGVTANPGDINDLGHVHNLTSHTHPTPALNHTGTHVHNSVDHKPKYEEFIPIERINNGIAL